VSIALRAGEGLDAMQQENHSMELSISDEKTKELSDAPEEVGLANAITEGRTDDFVAEDEVFSILDGKAE
jgi:hypothetical protein